VPVAGKLIQSQESQAQVLSDIKAEYAKLRDEHARRKSDKSLLSIEAARQNKPALDWAGYTPPKPQFLGTRVFEDYDLAEIARYIDWTPFFQTWQLHGKFPAILEDAVVGEEARKLYEDAAVMLGNIIRTKSLRAKAIVGFWPANSQEDDILLHGFEEQQVEVACERHGSHTHTRYTVHKASETTGSAVQAETVLHHLRQQTQKAPGLPNYCLSDFIAPEDSGLTDYLGGFAVTAGIGIEALLDTYEKQHDDYNSILVKALADRLAEAFAELMHLRVRKEFWGYAPDEQLDNEALIKEKYRGIRPAPGYPACPDHTEKQALFDLLQAGRVDITLTESFAMYPASSVSGWYFSHPESRYFPVGKINKDQVLDYAQRKQLSLEDTERWLAPVLVYG
jgi:5-methyltetrahydrofolate--homocysteine methyltransferase